MYTEDTYKDILLTSDRVVIDTSAAMHNIGFRKFVDKNEALLERAGKKIYVPKVVWMELVRAYNSRNAEKVERSDAAISIISSHRNVFEIEDEVFFHDEMERCFADPVLLSDLILDKSDSSILLITNDKMLSRDADGINHQASCRGHKIATCFISDSGQLKPGYKFYKDEPEVIVKEVTRIVHIPEKKTKWEMALSVGRYIFVAVTGIVIGKYSDEIIDCFRNVKGGKCYGEA